MTQLENEFANVSNKHPEFDDDGIPGKPYYMDCSPIIKQKIKHVVNVTISIPNHPMVSKRNNTIFKQAFVFADCKESAVKKALQFYKRRGFKIHDHEYIGFVGVMP